MKRENNNNSKDKKLHLCLQWLKRSHSALARKTTITYQKNRKLNNKLKVMKQKNRTIWMIKSKIIMRSKIFALKVVYEFV